MNNPKCTTNQTYDQIAERYLATNRDRQRIIDQLDRFAQYLTPGDRVLDIGCGPGFDAALLRERGLRVVGLDRSRQMIQTGRASYPGAFIQGDMRHFPFGQIANGLWINASMLHIERSDVPQVLSECHRVLKPGGILYIAVKEGEGERLEINPYDNKRKRWFTYWHVETLTSAISNAGFKILHAESNGKWIRTYAQKCSFEKN